jgi:hypothetical protein
MNAEQPRILIAIVLVSVLLRVGVAVYLGERLPRLQDDYSYSLLASRLAAGHGYSFDEPWYPYGTPGGSPTAQWSFLYTAFLAAIYAVVGVHPVVARLVQAVLGGALLPWMVYRLAKRTDLPQRRRDTETQRKREGETKRGGDAEIVPLLAAAIAAVYAYFILYAARLVTETFYIVALLWSLERALALAERPSLGRSAVLGLALGVTTLLRQSILPWVPVLFAWFLWHWSVAGSISAEDSALPRPSGSSIVHRLSSIVGRRSYILPLLVASLVLAACIAPFTIRNYIVYDEFLLLNSNAGYAMYSAQHPMHGTNFQAFKAAPLPEDLRGQGLNEAQWDSALMRRGIQFVLEEPGRYLLLSLSRVLDYFEFWPTADSSLLYNVGRLVSFTLFLPFMVYGIILAVRRTMENGRRTMDDGRWTAGFVWLSRSGVGLLVLFMGFYSVLHVMTWAMTRYRLPVDAVAIIFAAMAIKALWEKLTAETQRTQSQ